MYYVANWTASILYMETVDRLYTAEQMWGHQSQSAPLKQLKHWDDFFLHDSASPNLDKQSSDHSLWPLIYYSEKKERKKKNLWNSGKQQKNWDWEKQVIKQ